MLLILAGVTINLTLGEKGIFTTAKNAAKNYTDAQDRELAGLDNFMNEITNTINGQGNNENNKKDEITPDTISPSAPVITSKEDNLSKLKCKFQIKIKTASTDNVGIQKYQYSVDGGESYQDWNEGIEIEIPTADTECKVCLRAVDYSGNVSENSNIISRTPNKVYYNQIYVMCLNRQDLEEDMEKTVSVYVNGQKTMVVIANSQEANSKYKNMTSEEVISRLFKGLLGRDADSSEVSSYASEYKNDDDSVAVSKIIDSIVGTEEWKEMANKWNVK